MKEKQYEKLFMIYVYKQLGENNTKVFDELVRNEKKYDRDFSNFSQEENNEFLTKWKKENNIKLSEWYYIGDYKRGKLADNGLPVIIERKN